MRIDYQTENRMQLWSDVLGTIVLSKSDAHETRKHPWQIVTSGLHYRTAEDAIAALEQCERTASTFPGAVVTKSNRFCEKCQQRINYGRFCGKCEFN